MIFLWHIHNWRAHVSVHMRVSVRLACIGMLLQACSHLALESVTISCRAWYTHAPTRTHMHACTHTYTHTHAQGHVHRTQLKCNRAQLFPAARQVILREHLPNTLEWQDVFQHMYHSIKYVVVPFKLNKLNTVVSECAWGLP
jgi:hypothetical protein